MKYLVNAIICFVSFIMYSIIVIIESVLPKVIIAFYKVNVVSFSYDTLSLDFSLIKIFFICFTAIFGGLTIYSFIIENRR